MSKIHFYLIALLITLSGCSGGSGSSSATPTAELKVVGITPLNGASYVLRDGNITVLFSADLKADSVNFATFYVTDEQNYSVDADKLIVNGNQAIFKPKSKLCAARKYTVTITSAIRGVNGEVTPADYTSTFTTQSSQWSTPELFSQATFARTAMDNHGNSIIVWWRYNNDGGIYEIVMSQLSGGIWSDPKVISGNATNVYSPDVAMDNNGNAIIVWNDWGIAGTTGGIVMIEYRNGVWSEPRIINTTPFTPSSPPEVSMNDGGNAIVVWSQDNSDIYKIEYSDGLWRTPVAVSNGGSAEYPQVVINNKGNAIITWYTSGKLYSREFQNGIWNYQEIISAVGEDSDRLYQISFDNNDNAIVVWVHTEELTSHVYRNEFRNGSWCGPVPVNPAGVYVRCPSVAMDNNGNAIMSWQQSINNIYHVFIAELRAGIWSEPTLVSSSGIFAANPFVKMDNSGNAILLWNQANGADWQAFRRQYINGVWTENYLMAVSHDQLNNITYDIAMDGTGDADIIWSRSDGSTWQLYRSRYH